MILKAANRNSPLPTRFGGGLFRLLFPAILFFTGHIQAQLIINNAVNAPDGVQSVLLGDGVTVSNITFSGTNEQIGEFTCTGCNLGLANGLVMGSGNVDGSVGPNSSGSFSLGPASGWGASDPDLFELSGNILNDAAVLQFDFVPSGDSVAFNFVFASEEYPEYANDQFNDAFGFFLSGPGISGPYLGNAANIALIPGTNLPVTINNLNNGTGGFGPCEFCQYYVNNSSSGNPMAIQADGFTRVLTARAQVQCGLTYHIKLAIADALDNVWDSWVFLEAGSFQSNQMQVAYTGPAFSPGDDSVFEGCDPAYLVFTRPADQTHEFTYNLSIQGVAQNGVDYELVAPTLTFAENAQTATIVIDAIDDDAFEGAEALTITILGDEFCMDQGPTYTVYINDIEPLNVVLPDVEINCGDTLTLTPEITGGVGYYRTIWQGNYVNQSLTIAPNAPMQISYTIVDTCGVNPFQGTVNITFPDYDEILVDLGPDQFIDCLDTLFIEPVISGGYGTYIYEWFNGGQSVSTDSTLALYGGAPGAVSLVVTDQCGSVGEGSMNLTFAPVPVLVDIGSDVTVTCLDTVPISSNVSGGVGAHTYNWITSDSQDLSDTQQVEVVPFNGNTTVTLTVIDQCGNVGVDAMNINVPPVPLFVDAGPDLEVNCMDYTTLGASVSGGVGDYTYFWSNGYTNLSFDSIFEYQVTGFSTVTVNIEDQCGGTGSDQVEITPLSPPITLILTPDTALCESDQVILEASATGGVGSLSYLWSPGGSEYMSIAAAPDATTTYTVTVSDQCGTSATGDVTVVVEEVQAGFTAEYLGDFGIQLTNQSLNAFYSVWLFDDGTATEEANPYHLFADMNPWEVTLQVVSAGGCVSEETKTFYPLANVYIPNCFTADDDGLNDVFQARGHDLAWFKIWIFNRWGELVYYSEDIDAVWDGSHLGGTHYSPDGMYTYQVKAQGIRGNVIEKTGLVFMTR